MNIIELIRNANLDVEEKKVINILCDKLENSDSSITIRELSKLSYMSTSSIVRLSKKIGFFGYSDMVYSLKKYFRETTELKSSEIFESVSISKESLMIIDDLIKCIMDNPDKRIHISALGYSDLVAQYLRDKLIELDYFATNINPLDLLVAKPFILIVISNSGESVDLIKIVQKCKKEEGNIIYLITSQENSTLSKMIENRIVLCQDKVANIKYGSYFTGNAIVLSEKIVTAIYNLKRYNEKEN